MKANMLLGIKVIRFDRRAQVYVSHCPLLNMFGQGKTKREALTCMQDMVQSWFDICSRNGTLEAALQQRGIKLEELVGVTTEKLEIEEDD